MERVLKNISPLISVIVPVYNGAKFLPRCLGALFGSDHKAFEVLVVNDCSTDESAEISRSYGATVLTTDKQMGPGGARNLAAERANGEILLFVDSDVVVECDTLSKIAARFENTPGISALFGSYDDAPAEPNFLSQYKNLCHHYVHQISSSEASTFWAGLGAVRRDVFKSAGGFDCERFKVPSIEDIDLGVRLREAGHRIYLDRDIRAKHLKRWEIVSLLRTDIFCRALPWSKLILTRDKMINDMNLRNADRISAVLVGLSVAVIPLFFWTPAIAALILLSLMLGVLLLNRKIFQFFAEKKGILFTAMAFPWQCLYFFYSGVTFVCAWFLYALPKTLGFGKTEEIEVTRSL
jgi:glycosyltransferase involved in cell wall biosynthesis